MYTCSYIKFLWEAQLIEGSLETSLLWVSKESLGSLAHLSSQSQISPQRVHILSMRAFINSKCHSDPEPFLRQGRLREGEEPTRRFFAHRAQNLSCQLLAPRSIKIGKLRQITVYSLPLGESGHVLPSPIKGEGQGEDESPPPDCCTVSGTKAYLELFHLLGKKQ